MIEITYSADGDLQIATFPDLAGDPVRVTTRGGPVAIRCPAKAVSYCSLLDGPRVDALLGLLERWRETGRLAPYKTARCPNCDYPRDAHDLGKEPDDTPEGYYCAGCYHSPAPDQWQVEENTDAD